MEFEVKHLIGGEGSMQIHIPFTIDFKPILVTLNYNSDVSYMPHFNGEKTRKVFTTPSHIESLFHLDNFQELIDMVTNALNMGKRDVYCEKTSDYKSNYKWTQETEVKELLYHAGVNWTYYIYTKLRHAIYFHDNWQGLLKYSDVWKSFNRYEKEDIEGKFNLLYIKHWDYLYQQGIFHKRKDIQELSKETVDNFIKNLKR